MHLVGFIVDALMHIVGFIVDALMHLVGFIVGTCGYGEGLSGSINAGNFLTSCKVYLLASQEGLCSME
jgi:hypothetical protein